MGRSLYLNGTTDQYLYLGAGKSFDCQIQLTDTTGSLVLGSSMIFNSNVNLGRRRLVAENYQIKGYATIQNERISQPNLYFYGGGLTSM